MVKSFASFSKKKQLSPLLIRQLLSWSAPHKIPFYSTSKGTRALHHHQISQLNLDLRFADVSHFDFTTMFSDTN